MELKEIVKKSKNYRNILILSVFIGLIVGLIFFFIPPKYISSGSFYVKREIEVSSDFFTYEGYYAQQSAISYASNLSVLAQSPDIKKMVLTKMGIPVSESSLRDLGKSVKIKKSAPQLISISVKNKDEYVSKDIWSKTAESLLEISQEINKNGDNKISVSPVSKEPVVRETYQSPYVFSIAGAVAGLALGLFFISIKEYFKD